MNHDYAFVITTFNFGSFVGSLLDQISTHMALRNESYEIIIIDDGSTQSDRKIMEDWKLRRDDIKIKLFLGTNLGVKHILKRFKIGVDLSDSKYIIPMSGDDIFTDNFFTSIIPFSNPNKVIYSRGYEVITGNIVGECTSDELVSFYDSGNFHEILKHLVSNRSKLWLQGSIIPFELLRLVQFPTFDFADDWVLNFEIILAARDLGYSVSFMNTHGFFHRRLPSGATAKSDEHRERVGAQIEYLKSRMVAI
jgi:glycosyltransferase involved in cell wall biosynthesis